MKVSKAFSAGVLFAVCGLSASSLLAEGQAKYPDGQITFYEKYENGAPSGDSCSFSTIDRPAVNFADGDNVGKCKDDQYSYFKLDNVPSATIIKLESERCNGTTQEWNFQLKTYIQPITTALVDIVELKDKPVSDEIPLTKGLLLTSKKTNTDVPFKGKLSCVRIIRSQLP